MARVERGVAWLACVAVTLLSAAARAAPPPNVIILLADDLGLGDLGMNGAPIRTPNIDGLAREGATLTHFYAAANLCTPSRASLLTGRYAIRSGLAHEVIDADSANGLPAAELTLAEMLREQGYATALIGKWHLGHRPEHWPTRHGFDYYFGLPYSNDMQPLALFRGSDEVEEPVEQSTLTRRYTEEALQFIDRRDERPFFVLLAYAAPHIPLHASPDFAGRSAVGPYGDAVEELDWSVGEVRRGLTRRGLDSSTLLILTSDNGAWFEGSNAHLRGGKGDAYEGGYRVPFIAWWPGQIRPATRSDGMAMNIDLLPTIAARTGARTDRARAVDGMDIWPLLGGSRESPHDVLYLFHNEDVAAVRTQRWKYLARGLYRRNYVAFDRFRDGFGFDYPQLFDMGVEAPERYSVAAREPAALHEMQRLLERGRRDFGALRTHPAEKAFP